MKIMKHPKLITVFSTFITLSLLTASFGYGVLIGDKKVFGEERQISDVNLKNSKYIWNLTQLAKDGQISPVADIDPETEKIVRILSSAAKQNPVLVDEFSGKSQMILSNLAVSLLSEDAAANLRGKNVFKIDTAAIIADAKSQAQVESIFLNVLDQVKAAKGNHILFIEDLTALAKESPTFGAEVAKSLRQTVIDGKIQILTTGTNESYNLHIAMDAQLKNRFQKVQLLDEADEDGFVGDKLSPELRELVANSDPNKKVKVILQSDDIKNPELANVLQRNNVLI